MTVSTTGSASVAESQGFNGTGYVDQTYVPPPPGYTACPPAPTTTSSPPSCGFTLQTNANQLNPSSLYAAAEDSSGEVTVLVDSSTAYLIQDPSSGNYNYSNYATVVTHGANIQVFGRFTYVNGSTQLVAITVYNPPQPAVSAAPPPPNPKPCTTCTYAYSFRAGFAVDASVSQISAAADPLLGIYDSQAFGFIVNNITNYYNSPLVQEIAAAHGKPGGNPPVYVPQLTITSDAATKFYLQQPDGSYQLQTNRANEITLGRKLSVYGKFGWDGTDWRFLATMVIAPPLGQVTGQISFQEATSWNGDGTAGGGGYQGAQYSGAPPSSGSVTGDGQINPGPVTFTNDSAASQTSWTYDSTRKVWVFTADWQASHQPATASTPDGVIGGTITLEWDPTTFQTNGTVLLDPAKCSGTYAGLTSGAGSFSPFAALAPNAPTNDPAKPPTGSLNGAIVLKVTR